jgi:4-aminobutyrate aminotransferase-like enzyme
VDVLARYECPAITARRARRKEVSGVEQDPIVWERARGACVTDPDGNRFVDLTAGFGVASCGHGNPAVRAAVHAQVDRLVHGLGDAYPGRPRVELAEALARVLPGGLCQSIFASSGSEAVEAAIKCAVLATGRSRVVAFEDGYHGMSLGALPRSHYKPDFRQPFAGILPRIADFLRFGADLDGLRRTLREGEPVAALLVEPVQGRGGVNVAPPGWLRGLREACDEAGALLIFDEVMTGFGRGGELVLAGTAAADGVVPDLICLGKGLTSGFPLSACVGTERAMAGWGRSTGEAIHTSTFLGHPVGCAAALAVLALFERGGLLERGRELGGHMEGTLRALAERHPGRLSAPRGRGAIWGLTVSAAPGAPALCRCMLERGFLLIPAGRRGDALSFTPPLTTTRAQWDAAMQALEDCL